MGQPIPSSNSGGSGSSGGSGGSPVGAGSSAEAESDGAWEHTRPLPDFVPPYAYGQQRPPGQPPLPPYGQRPGGGWSGGDRPGGDGPGSGSGSGRPRRRGAAAVVALALAAGLVGGGAGTAATYFLTRGEGGFNSTALDQPVARFEGASNAPAGSVQQVANKLLPSVVSITIATSQGSGNGSGIVLSKDGLILTNNHVAAAGQGGSLSVTFNDGKTVKASVVGTDPVTDLAVLRASRTSGLTPAVLGSSGDLSVGQNVVAIGSPLGLSGTVTSGIVSALDRPVPSSDSSEDQNTVIDAIQTDAAINPGNS
ncbi:S1C family serine protease, partial [Actinopolymorpha pittospori]|uniref:S1C family serine protease n=1 Tax=Actinopolymorpha pittospori TaxID=648752 RepID=UPI0031F07C5D